MELHTIWFVIIAIFWVGFFVLEGFDFGVGVLHTIVGQDRHRAAGGAEHDRPLVGRQRGVAGHRRRQHVRGVPGLVRDDVLGAVSRPAARARGADGAAAWRSSSKAKATVGAGARRGRGARRSAACWSRCCWASGSAICSVGLPIDSSHDFTGDFFNLLTGYGLWTGVTLLGLCLLHGATFLKLRTTDQVRERARYARAASGMGRDRARRWLRDLDAQSRWWR